MKFKINHYFNLIEIAMALGVIGFGVSSIMAVIPASLQNAGVSVSQNYASNTADIFFSYIDRSLKSDNSAYYVAGAKDHTAFGTSLTALTSETTKPANLSEAEKYSASATQAAESIGTNSLDTSDPILKNIFNGSSGVYKVVQGTTPSNPEFAAVIRVWKKNITTPDIKILRSSGIYNAPGSITINDNASGTSGECLAGIFVEVSWPAHKPYGMRDSHLYYKEIYDIYD